ncbi:RNA polymerase sigma factor [Paenibacillus sp. UNCCL117]|uniref:RNA polymerase sigma factor SigI n=1 Tax=unclassified Paenibacillus TaxID=185978 RepID=UPI000882ADD4|nr:MULTISPECIES: RNA polymerase sigma factor SigI [unclassified Paenibacillus]SDE23441.1 RNA polymerase sigma factor [Paenibacillus sp. cl123]SFW42608.1 RNA polymerase sigma factor [Paenibacillus sp. UNCCL117]
MLLVLFKKFLGKRQTHHPASEATSTPEEIVIRIQEGDLRLRNQFITDYQPYVAKVTSRFCKRYVDPTRDDEFSIALGAFNEAINQFSPQAGRSFLGFAEQVMRRRLIDYVRKEQRFAGQIPYSTFEVEDEEDHAVNPIEIHQAIEEYEKQKGMEERRSEIVDLSRMLAEFGIQFEELADASPKHDDSRQALFAIAYKLSGDMALMKLMLGKKMLPIKELLDQVSVSRKTLERNRKFIITVALIYSGPFPYLKDYLHIKGDEAERDEEVDHEGRGDAN